jgi:hypothetical protein
MSDPPAKSRRRKLTKYLFCISAVALVFFNAYAAICKRQMSQSIESASAEIHSRREQSKELGAIQKRFFESIDQFREVEAMMHQIHLNLQDKDQLRPILDHEFVVTNIDGGFESGKRTVNVTTPKYGSHQLRIQIKYKHEQLLDKQFDLVSGQGYRVKFILQNNNLQLLFPGREPTDIEVDNFEFANRITGLRRALTGRPTFVSINQPRWRLSPHSDAAEYGELARFSYMSTLYELEDHIIVRISAKSDGPPTAAVDDTATVFYLTGLLESGFEPKYRYENGRYFFEEETK